ncbi:UbiA family prenyltransferase [Streptomyces sp. NBC_00846]|uniref:UbiA family prenyltransferase n=1 Tax=Streptomyces sp. NBC_00846 TaxID=2975849 RepID=UPI00386B5A0B|nr:UbiA family prenyltransferase [Streptomyces sp. NBC_00846]
MTAQTEVTAGRSAPGPLAFLAWTNVTLGASAAAFTWVTSLALNRPGDPLIAAFAFLFIAGSYTRDRLDPADTDSSPRAAWMARHRRHLTRWTIACAAALLPVTILRPWCAAVVALVGTMAWLYTAPLIPWRGRRLAVRQLPGVKLPYTMAGWLPITVLLPAVQQHHLLDARTWYLAVAGTLIGSVTALLNDLRDLDTDALAGTSSLPVLLGDRRTRFTAYGMAACGAAVGQLALPVPAVLWATYNSTLLASYRPRPGAYPRPWGDAQGLVLLAAVLLTR